METQSGRGWLVNAFSIFLLVLSLWILAALWAGSTFGATFPLLADLRSHIFADYGSDALGRTLKSLQLTILGDINGGLSFGDGPDADRNQSFQGLVPTATQHGTQGSTEVSDSPTEEPELPTHTATEEPPPTHTNVPKTPTQTPKPTKTPKATSTSAPPTPEPTPKHDVEAPILSGGILNPPPGVLSVCEIEIQITDLEVVDHPWSSGIEWVKLKYRVEGYSDYVYSPPLTLKSGGPTPEGGWNGCYNGEVYVEIDPGWESHESDMYIVNVWAKARDYAGLAGYLWLGEYHMPASCGGNDE